MHHFNIKIQPTASRRSNWVQHGG